ncbi:hypothetical protein D030_2045A, partial [Vibrio parahaemolyticus AQ3810]
MNETLKTDSSDPVCKS